MTLQTHSYSPMTAHEFAYFGIFDHAYIKPVMVNGGTVYAIHAANGSLLWCLPVRDIAIAILREHDMKPLSVH